MQIANLILEYLRVILSSHIVFGIVIIIVLYILRKDITSLFGRIAKIKFPGGEVATTQVERDSESPTQKSQIPEITEPEVNQKKESPTPEDYNNLLQKYIDERALSHLWEYRFLNIYLVRNTQLFLDWLFSSNKPTALRLADAYLMQNNLDPKERFAIINALINHYLINEKDDLLLVTEKGKEYIEWRGPINKQIR